MNDWAIVFVLIGYVLGYIHAHAGSGAARRSSPARRHHRR